MQNVPQKPVNIIGNINNHYAKNTKEKRIGLRLTKLEHLNLQIQSEKQSISISKLVRKKLFNEKN